MSRFTSQTAPTSYGYPPVGAADRLWVFLKSVVRFEPAATAVYAENDKVRMSGRNWLM
jgi:hypothetical protein